MNKKLKKYISILILVSVIIISLGRPVANLNASEVAKNNTHEMIIEKMKVGSESLFSTYYTEDMYKEEKIRIMVQLEEEATIDKVIDKESSKEIEVKNCKEDIIKKVEDITLNKVIKNFGYLVNGFTIDGVKSDIPKIKDIDGVKDVCESIVNYPSNNTNNLSSYDIERIYDNDNDLKGEGTVISIIDTGIDPYHKDMKKINNKDIKITKESAKGIISELGRGVYISDKIPYAFNYADGDTNMINTFDEHGMHVSGIAAANGEFKGIASETQILAMKVSSSFGGGFYIEDVLLAIEDSVRLGADVINMSFGSDSQVRAEESLYKSAIEKATKLGVICVNAAGNSQTSVSTSAKDIPKNNLGIKDTSLVDNASPYTLTVASADKNNNISRFSSWGPSADLELKPEIVALGEKVYSTVNDNKYATYSGTSMASPMVSGGQALVIQSIKNRFKDIKGEEVVSFSKNTVMNTAKPLYNKDVIYSPRQQGAGLLNIEDAIKNNVIATDFRGKASITLKSINEKTSFQIHLKNYSDKDITYKVNKTNLYTEQVLDDLTIKEVIINNAKVNYDSDIVTVKGNSTTTVSGEIVLPDNLEKQSFVEGYISLIYLGEDGVDLSVPILAFYGEWGEEKILDDPIYEDTSIRSITGLGKREGGRFNYYGSFVDSETNSLMINTNNIAFSPNNDGSKDDVSLITYFLRNSKNYNIKVLDEDKNFIGNEVNYYNIVKSINYDKIGNQNKMNQYYYYWDGTEYDSKSGKFNYVEDGKYYIRVTNTAYDNKNTEQIIDFPIKVDKEEPELKNIKINSFKEGKDYSYQIQWDAEDNVSGMLKYAEYILNDDISRGPTELTNIQEIDGVFSAMIDLKQGVLNKITLGVMDNAGNIKTMDAYYDAINEGDIEGGEIDYEPIIFSRLKDNSYVNVGGGKYTIKGFLREDVESVFINNEKIDITEDENERTINEFVTLKEGKNIISVKALGTAEEALFSKDYTVFLDREKPKNIKVTPFDTSKVQSVEEEEITFTVKAEDTSSMNCIISNLTSGVDYKGELDKNGDGEVTVTLETGLNELELEVVDAARNTSEKQKVYIVKVKDKDELNVGFVNIFNSDYKVPSGTTGDYIEVIGYVTKTPKKLQINNEDVLINDDYTFKKMVKLTEGLNKIKIYAVDNDDSIVEQYAYRIYYDKDSPSITLDLDSTFLEDGIFYTESKDFKIKGTAYDSNSDYKVYLNGNMIINTSVGAVSDEDILKRSFEIPFTLSEGENYFNFRTVDKFGNDNMQKINVIYTKVDEEGSDTETLDSRNSLSLILFLLSFLYILSNLRYKKKSLA